MIRFNIPYISGNELKYIADALEKGHLAGDGEYSKRCRQQFIERYKFQNNYLTTSGTDALEMAAILANIQPGDEVIMPSYTFVSTANAFVLRGAKIIFADSYDDHPNMNHNLIEELLSSKTKAIVPVHYGGIACEMDAIMSIAEKNNLLVIEDAAQAIDSFYKDKPLGLIGDYGAFSFHETKNINCGEGGMLVVRDNANALRAEVVREKGTNRTAFFRGEVDKYGWVDVGSSFLASEIIAAFLFAQLEQLEKIQTLRKNVWNNYNAGLKSIQDFGFKLPTQTNYSTNNGHVFYLICPNLETRTQLMNFLNENGIKAVFHYQPLHNSTYFKDKFNSNRELPNAIKFADTLLRLPVYPSLSNDNQNFIIDKVQEFVTKKFKNV